MDYLKNFIYGMILGVANIIPAISGGTMAVILNIYDKILYAISLKNVKRNLSFLIPLGLGCVASIFALSNVMISLMEHYTMILNFCFIGLIIGSVPMIYKRARYEKIKGRNVAIFFLALAFMFLMAMFGNGGLSNKTLAELGGLDLRLATWLLFVSAISTIAMILPGISGSFVMLLLGAYTIALEALANLNILVIIPIGIGIMLGGFIGIKFIKTMLRFHPQALYFAILGLIIGSIYSIYPGFIANIEGFLSLVLMLVFAVISYLFSKNSA